MPSSVNFWLGTCCLDPAVDLVRFTIHSGASGFREVASGKEAGCRENCGLLQTAGSVWRTSHSPATKVCFCASGLVLSDFLFFQSSWKFRFLKCKVS